MNDWMNLFFQGDYSLMPTNWAAILLGLLLALVGLGFKIAAFPFQMWAPDVYQGSPAPVTGWRPRNWLTTGSKICAWSKACTTARR